MPKTCFTNYELAVNIIVCPTKGDPPEEVRE
jgi:hypothetical protein